MIPGRILAGCFWFCVLIWNATYTANLASFLVLKTSALPVTSLSQAVSMDYNMIMIRNSAIAKVVEKSKNTLYQEIWQKVQRKNTFDDTHEEAVSRIRNAGKSAFIAEEPFLNYYKGRLKCNLVMGKRLSSIIIVVITKAVVAAKNNFVTKLFSYA